MQNRYHGSAPVSLKKRRRRKSAPLAEIYDGIFEILHVEAEIDHVAILDDVLLALAAQQSLFLCRRDAAAADHVVEIDRFGADEAALDVGVNFARGLRGLGAVFDGPGAALVLAVGQERDEAEQRVGALDQAVEAGLLNAEVLEEHRAVLTVELGDVLLELGANRQNLRALAVGELLDLLEILVAILIRKAVLVHVRSVDDGLEAQKIGGRDELSVVGRNLERARALARVEVLGKSREELDLVQELLVALGHLRRLFHAAVDHLKVSHDELQVDRLNVAEGIDGDVRAGVGHDVHDVLIVEAAHDVDNGVRAADVLEELVAEARALARALDEARDVDKLDDGGSLLLGVVHLGELIEALIGNGHHADVRLNGAEGVVGAFRARVGDRVEESGLADIRQSDDS